MALPVDRVVPDAYNLHKKLEVNEACEHGFDEKFYSRNDAQSKVFEFQVEGNSEHCIVLNQCYLKFTATIKGKAKRTSGQTVTEVDIGGTPEPKVFPVNNIFHSAFESAEVYLGLQATTKVDKHNAYVGYINTLNGYGPQPLGTYHQLQGWAKDTAGSMDSLDSVFAERAKLFTVDGKECSGEFMGRICSPIFLQDKILPPQVPMRVILKRSEDAFALMHEDGEFSLTITDAVFIVRKVAVTPSVRESYMRIAEQGNPLLYYLKTPSVNYYSIQQNSTQFMRDDLFMGKLPRRVIIGMVRKLILGVYAIKKVPCGINVICCVDCRRLRRRRITETGQRTRSTSSTLTWPRLDCTKTGCRTRAHPCTWTLKRKSGSMLTIST
jgi:hypothetical protein